MFEQAIFKETGEYFMTLAENLRKEDEEKGIRGLKEAIEKGMAVKFPGDIASVMAEVNKINDLDALVEITKTTYTTNDSSEILALLK